MNFYQIHYILDCKPVTSKVQAGNIISAIGVLGEDASSIYKVELVWTQTVDVPSYEARHKCYDSNEHEVIKKEVDE